jgi:hypothetical protein
MNKTKMVAYTKYRFDFSSEVGELLATFSDNHESEKYKVFQLSWSSWINKEDVRGILTKECDRLQKEGYKGDIWDKMYKSARYYYKKRALVNNKEDNNLIVKRSPNIKFSTNYLNKLKENIVSQLKNNITDKILLINKFRPSEILKIVKKISKYFHNELNKIQIKRERTLQKQIDGIGYFS